MSDSSAAAPARLPLSDWSAVLLVVALACAVRLLFLTGLIGSDDVIYTGQALAIVHGEWSTDSTYVGALRYGINLPMAGFMALLGISEFTANLWSLTCSLGEVATVFLLGRYMWGLRAALLASLVLALLPLHVHLSGLILGDTPLAFFVTLGFAMFYLAERERHWWLYLASGLSLGAVYWVKESVAPLLVPTFVVYAIISHTFRREWLIAILGAAVMVLLNMAFMWWVSGDPLQMFYAMERALEGGATLEGLATSPGFYLLYLFVDIKHTWLMPFLAVACMAGWLRERRKDNTGTSYIVLWALGLLLTLSFSVVSISPIRFIFKQTNYMLIFAAPLALLAGHQLARMRTKWLTLTLFVLISGSILLSALEQQAVRVFVANARATVSFAAAHPGVPVYSTSFVSSLSYAVAALGGQWPAQSSIRTLSELPTETDVVPALATATTETAPAAFSILDMETSGRRRGELILSPANAPSCWRHVGIIDPEGFGIGRTVLHVLRNASEDFMPERAAAKILSGTQRLYSPRPAHVYAIPPACAFVSPKK